MEAVLVISEFKNLPVMIYFLKTSILQLFAAAVTLSFLLESTCKDNKKKCFLFLFLLLFIFFMC